MSHQISNAFEIGTNRQLFVDDHLISCAKGVDRILHSPIKRDVAIASENPWEKTGFFSGSFLFDEGIYKCWYRCDDDTDGKKTGGGRWTAYAESQDGINWEKPNLGIFNYHGSQGTNLVWKGPGSNLAPFRDPNPDVPDNQRYKGVVRTRDLLALASPDGLNWRLLDKEPILTERPFDSPNVSFWDTNRSEYVTYVRGLTGSGSELKRKLDISIWKEGVRWIRRASSKDFRTWSSPELIDIGEIPKFDFYSNSCVIYDRAPSYYFMFPSRFNVIREPRGVNSSFSSGINDIVFMSSRDGLRFDFGFKEAFLRPGLDVNNWHNRGIYIDRGILHTGADEMSIYGVENRGLQTENIHRYTLRTDGFVSIRAGYGGGEFTTKPFVYSGNSMFINYSTSAVGSIRVELQDSMGTPLKGFQIEDCIELFGDTIDEQVVWNSRRNLGSFAGKQIRLRFLFNDADIYAFKFND